MSKTLLLVLLVIVITPSLAFGQSDFPTFWGKFKSAVQRNDKASVKSLMAPRFEWALDGYVSRDEAWGYFAEQKRYWLGMREAVNRKPIGCKDHYCNNRSGYHIWSSRKFGLEIMFERIGGSWRWSALLGD